MTVYKPAEDTYLVLEHLEGLNCKDKKFLDMGTGNGEIALKAAEKGAEVTAADINSEAIDYAREKAEEKGLEDEIKFVETDLFENIDGKYDIITFNPPYLPGQQDIGDEEIWRGGEKGIEVTENFLKQVRPYLKDSGCALLVISSLADIEDLKERYDIEKIESQGLWFEELELVIFE